MRALFRTAFLFFLILLPVRGEEEHWFRSQSDGGDCLVEACDPVLADDLVALAAHLRVGVALPASAKAGRLLIRVENHGPEDPLFARRGNDWQLTLFAAPGSSGIPAAWVRPVLAGLLLQNAVGKGMTGTTLPPFWLTEGSFQTAAGGQEELLAQIIRRAVRAGTVPSLDEIMSWKEPGQAPLFAAWRQAFAWQARLFFLADPGRAVFLEKWTHPLPIQHEDLEKAWRQFVKEGPPLAPLASWEETAALMNAERETGLLLPKEEAKPEKKLSWDQLPQARADTRFRAALEKKIGRLEVLEMRAPFAWRPVVALYRDALSSLRPDHFAGYPARLAAARKADAQLADLAQQTHDYLNWYEVARAPADRDRSPFSVYFRLATEFDAVALPGRAP